MGKVYLIRMEIPSTGEVFEQKCYSHDHNYSICRKNFIRRIRNAYGCKLPPYFCYLKQEFDCYNEDIIKYYGGKVK